MLLGAFFFKPKEAGRVQNHGDPHLSYLLISSESLWHIQTNTLSNSFCSSVSALPLRLTSPFSSRVSSAKVFPDGG